MTLFWVAVRAVLASTLFAATAVQSNGACRMTLVYSEWHCCLLDRGSGQRGDRLSLQIHAQQTKMNSSWRSGQCHTFDSTLHTRCVILVYTLFRSSDCAVALAYCSSDSDRRTHSAHCFAHTLQLTGFQARHHTAVISPLFLTARCRCLCHTDTLHHHFALTDADNFQHVPSPALSPVTLLTVPVQHRGSEHHT